MDQVDFAEIVSTDELERIIAAARGIILTSGKKVPSSRICTDCTELIPNERYQAVPGCVRCISCQEDYERYGKVKNVFKNASHSLDEVIEDIYQAIL